MEFKGILIMRGLTQGAHLMYTTILEQIQNLIFVLQGTLNFILIVSAQLKAFTFRSWIGAKGGDGLTHFGRLVQWSSLYIMALL